MTFKEKLIEFNACQEAIEWAGDKTMQQCIEQCHRGDWLLWLFVATQDFSKESTLRNITLAKGYCANTVLHLMNDNRSKEAVNVAIRFGNGEATIGELNNNADAAAAYAYYADDACYAAYYAAAANTSYDAADAAADASYDAADYAVVTDDYAAAAKEQNQKLTADICREHLKWEIMF